MSYIPENAFPTLAAAVEDFKKERHYFDANGCYCGLGGERVHEREVQPLDTVGLNIYKSGGVYWYEIVPAYCGTNVQWRDLLEGIDAVDSHEEIPFDWWDPDWTEYA